MVSALKLAVPNGLEPSSPKARSLGPVATPAQRQDIDSDSHQAAGQVADKRSDIWSFGVVLYEMLTGQRLFTGETVPHVLARVLDRDLEVSTLLMPTPALVKRSAACEHVYPARLDRATVTYGVAIRGSTT
jgi:serine/threonine protein kinase